MTEPAELVVAEPTPQPPRRIRRMREPNSVAYDLRSLIREAEEAIEILNDNIAITLEDIESLREAITKDEEMRERYQERLITYRALLEQIEPDEPDLA